MELDPIARLRELDSERQTLLRAVCACGHRLGFHNDGLAMCLGSIAVENGSHSCSCRRFVKRPAISESGEA